MVGIVTILTILFSLPFYQRRANLKMIETNNRIKKSTKYLYFHRHFKLTNDRNCHCPYLDWLLYLFSILNFNQLIRCIFFDSLYHKTFALFLECCFQNFFCHWCIYLLNMIQCRCILIFLFCWGGMFLNNWIQHCDSICGVSVLLLGPLKWFVDFILSAIFLLQTQSISATWPFFSW